MSVLQPNTVELAADLPRIHYDATMSFVHPALAKAFAYWNRCRGTRTMPRRRDLSANDMRDFITHVGLVEVRQGKDGTVNYYVRLSGSHIDDVLGPRSRRMLTEDLPPQIAARWRSQYDHVLETLNPLRAFGRIAYENKTWLESENLYAPLGDEGAAPDMIFYAFAVIGRGEHVQG